MELTVRDVTLRDGLQNEEPLTIDEKLRLLEAILAAGVTDLEVGSFVRADRVPAMADTEQLVAAAGPQPGSVTLWALVLNARGAERALAAGLSHLQFVVSASEEHNRTNAGRTIDESVAELARINDRIDPDGSALEVVVATAFGCPYAGPVAEDLVLQLVERLYGMGIGRLSLADTIGTAVPMEVSSLFGKVSALDPDVVIGAHLHDTRGLAIANAFAAIGAGAARLDGSTGGLGGCPFAPGATGNLALEDLVHALQPMGHLQSIDLSALIEAGRLACELVGQPPQSHLASAGPRFARR
jgi:hydroxymethylglutaryl-CoA lyase